MQLKLILFRENLMKLQSRPMWRVALLMSLALAIAGCEGDDGATGPAGAAGVAGQDGQVGVDAGNRPAPTGGRE